MINRVEITDEMVSLGKFSGSIFFESEYSLQLSPELIITATLIANMKQNKQVCYSGMQIGRQFKENIASAEMLLRTWHPEYGEIVNDAQEVDDEQQSVKANVGCFFSGGVDSFYTLLERQSEITHLICVQGFDIPIKNDDLFNMVKTNLTIIAESFGIKLITIKTNLRKFFEANEMGWGAEAFGAGLATVGHLLSGEFNKIYIPASLDMNNLMPWGSHPDLDPLWSSASLQFVHHGCVPRADKIKRLASNDLALKFLRVCYLNKNNAYNCGRCEKCLRTMITLRAFGVLDRCESFKEKLTIRSIRKLWITSEAAKIFLRENIDLLAEKGSDPDLQKALEELLKKPEWKVKLYLWVTKKKNRIISIIRYLVMRIKAVVVN